MRNKKQKTLAEKLATAWLRLLLGLVIAAFLAIAVFLIGFLIYYTVQGAPGVWPIDIAFIVLILTGLSLYVTGNL